MLLLKLLTNWKRERKTYLGSSKEGGENVLKVCQRVYREM